MPVFETSEEQVLDMREVLARLSPYELMVVNSLAPVEGLDPDRQAHVIEVKTAYNSQTRHERETIVGAGSTVASTLDATPRC